MRVVVDSLMMAQMLSRQESFVAITFWAGKRLGTQMNGDNVTLQRVLLSECLATVAETTTTKFLMTLVYCHVILESSRSHEAPVATFPRALVVSNFGMSTLDVMFQVAGAQVSL